MNYFVFMARTANVIELTDEEQVELKRRVSLYPTNISCPSVPAYNLDNIYDCLEEYWEEKDEL